jgi:hypothetical protein
MLKGVYKKVLERALSGIWLIIALLIGVGVGILVGGNTPAKAASYSTTRNVTECTEENPKPSFGSTVVVGSSDRICGSLTAFGGTTVVQGEVKGGIIAFADKVIINGLVDGNVNLYGGSLTLQNGAHINGDIHVCGGQWIEGETSQLHGTVFECTKSVTLLLSGNGSPGSRFWLVFTWVALALLLTFLLPEHVMLVRTTVRSKMRRSFVLGLLTILLTPAVLSILIALIIPIPLAIIVAIGLIAAWALGTVAVGWLIGDYLVHMVAPHYYSRPIQVAVGSAVLALVGTLPYIGWIISIGAGLLGLGAVFLSRFGTRLYVQPEQPLSL